MDQSLGSLQEAGVSEHAGFPNAATDASLTSLNIAGLLVQHPISTFFMRVRGHSGDEYGVFDGDVVVVDRALHPLSADQIIWWHEESFVLGKPQAVPDGIIPWGVVTYVIHQTRRQNDQ